MKNKFSVLAALAMGLASVSNAQNATLDNSATASAQIVVPISIAKGADLNFGSIIRSGAGGTVALDPSGGIISTGVVLFTGSSALGTSPASYTISGEAFKAYVVSLPADNAVVLNDGSGNTMKLTAFAHNATGLFSDSPETFHVGATLNVGANQAPGNYVSGAISVTVAYN